MAKQEDGFMDFLEEGEPENGNVQNEVPAVKKEKIFEVGGFMSVKDLTAKINSKKDFVEEEKKSVHDWNAKDSIIFSSYKLTEIPASDEFASEEGEMIKAVVFDCLVKKGEKPYKATSTDAILVRMAYDGTFQEALKTFASIKIKYTGLLGKKNLRGFLVLGYEEKLGVVEISTRLNIKENEELRGMVAGFGTLEIVDKDTGELKEIEGVVIQSIDTYKEGDKEIAYSTRYLISNAMVVSAFKDGNIVPGEICKFVNTGKKAFKNGREGHFIKILH